MLLTNRGPPDWHPASDELKKLCSEAGAYCASQGVELGKLSVYHNLVSLEDNVAITILGVGKIDILNINLDLVFDGLTEKEVKVLNTVRTKYFQDLEDIAWDEGVWDLDIYKEDKTSIKRGYFRS